MKKQGFLIIGILFIFILLFIGCHYEIDNKKLVENLINEIDTTTPTKINFDTTHAKGFFIDKRDGNKYKTIKIGNQVWMAENLRFITKKGSYCLNDKDSNCSACGRLYELEAAKTASPEGWRLPAESDWDTLIYFVGGNFEDGYGNLIEGGPSGFDAKLCGYRGSDGNYSDRDGHYWTSTVFDKNSEPVWILFNDFESHIVNNTCPDPKIGFSVRCIKNEE